MCEEIAGSWAGYSDAMDQIGPPPEAVRMPSCPECGSTVRAVEWLLAIEREDDGRRGVCKYVLYCPDDGALWKWADRPDDPWTMDPVSTALLAQRLAPKPDRS